jgi:hypothetical protein
MKRVLCFVLSLLILAAITGCGKADEPQGETLNTVSNTTPESSLIDINQAIPTFRTLEDYGTYISSGVDTKSFITYEMVQDYGTFALFADYGRPKCNTYLYELIDKNGYRLDIDIEPRTPLTEVPETATDVQLHNYNDLRTNPAHLSAIKVNNVYYTYYEGKLYSIAWYTDTHIFTIKAGRTVRPSEYPDGETTLISRLLNGETAEAAVAEFNANIAAKQHAQAEAD